jgi:hypothetical protein
MRRLGQGVQIAAEIRKRPAGLRADRAVQPAPVPVRPQREKGAGDAVRDEDAGRDGTGLLF